MISTAPPLTLTREQASRLQGYIQMYRRYAFASLAPSSRRNTTLRLLQTIQGKLIVVMDQRAPFLTFVATREEMAVLRTTVEELRLLTFQEPATAERDALMADLRALSATLEHY